MKYRELYSLIIAIVLAIVIVSCGSDNELPSTQNDISNDVSAQLAPTNTDQKIYVTPLTMKYHLANCRELTDDKQVWLMSEAISQGYTACERCFPVPKTPSSVPLVYVMKEDTHYHLANCPKLNDTKTVIPKETAIQQGYTPCFYCTDDPITPPEPHVYILPNDHEYYHIVGCSRLTDDKELRLKSLAIEQGYKPCPECGVVIRLTDGLNRWVYITEDGWNSQIYHTNFFCKHLDHLNSQQKFNIMHKLDEIRDLGFRKCLDCDEVRQ
jgi:hypothetical protein